MDTVEAAYQAGIDSAMEKLSGTDERDIATRVGTGMLGAGMGSGLGGILSQGIEDDGLRSLAGGAGVVAGAGLGAYAPNLTAGMGGAIGGGTLGSMGGGALGRMLAERMGWDEEESESTGGRIGGLAGALGGGLLGNYGMRALRGER